ncbi:MAG: DUF4176 domain-containing protein [Lachnospiraceae bacterium]|nr:DUF4176 domain-containing protein [Lachnospiraceae bacterium]
MKELLPIGSVVLLRNGRKKLMIIGIKQADAENPSVIFDYSGVMYPEGYLGEKSFFLFNHKDIVDVIFTGYTNVEREEFISKVNNLKI